jgi:hypothetical protein
LCECRIDIKPVTRNMVVILRNVDLRVCRDNCAQQTRTDQGGNAKYGFQTRGRKSRALFYHKAPPECQAFRHYLSGIFRWSLSSSTHWQLNGGSAAWYLHLRRFLRHRSELATGRVRPIGGPDWHFQEKPISDRVWMVEPVVINALATSWGFPA